MRGDGGAYQPSRRGFLIVHSFGDEAIIVSDSFSDLYLSDAILFMLASIANFDWLLFLSSFCRPDFCLLSSLVYRSA